MAINQFIQQGDTEEQSLYESLIIESIQMYGQDVYYLPRTVINELDVIGEPSQSKFESYHTIEMYIETFDGWEGENNLFQKFGIEVRDQMSLIVSVSRWNEQVGFFANDQKRPNEGDLIYLPLSNGMFEIKFVEDEAPFYQLSQAPVYKIKCELFEYSGENFMTGLYEIDKYEYRYGSGGIQLIVENVNPENDPINLRTVELGQIFIQGSASGKLYSIEQTSTSPVLYTISLGQVRGNFNTSDENLINGERYQIMEVSDGAGGYQPLQVLDGSGGFENFYVYDEVAAAKLLNFKIKTVVGLDESSTDEEMFPTDSSADNVSIENEADDIINFSESNPFGEV